MLDQIMLRFKCPVCRTVFMRTVKKTSLRPKDDIYSVDMICPDCGKKNEYPVPIKQEKR